MSSASPPVPAPPTWTHPQIYCLVFGMILLVLGAAGLAVNSSFEGASAVGELQDREVVSSDRLLVFAVNGWHNVLHIVSGVGLLVCALRWRWAGMAAVVTGLVYLLITVVGVLDGDDVAGLIAVNTADNVLHGVVAAVGFVSAMIASNPVAAEALAAHEPGRLAR